MANKYNVPDDYNHSLVQEALRAGDAGIAQQRQAGMNTINQAEQSMYDMLGRMQLQNERDIADQRIKALRSGQTSSQLAAMELQNLQAGQIGATSIMQDARNQRMMMEQEYAGQENMNRYYMLEMLGQNNKDLAAIEAQRYASSDLQQLVELFETDPATAVAMYKNMLNMDLDDNEQELIDNISRNSSNTSSGTTPAIIRDYYDESKADYNNLMTFNKFKRKTIDTGRVPKEEQTDEFTEAMHTAYDNYIKEFTARHGGN